MRLHDPERTFQVNPYTRWVYEHPRHLLPDPTPEQLAVARGVRAATRPLCVELGSGSGRFLIEQARRLPQVDFVGFELRFKRLVKSAQKAEKLGLDNVWILREYGERLFAYVSANSLDGLYVNFPDPWPKVAQWKKRLINADFLRRLHEVLRPGGWLRLKTDHSGYFLHVLSSVQNAPGWAIRRFSNDMYRASASGLDARSEFEQLFASQNKPIFLLHLEKSGVAASSVPAP